MIELDISCFASLKNGNGQDSTRWAFDTTDVRASADTSQTVFVASMDPPLVDEPDPIKDEHLSFVKTFF